MRFRHAISLIVIFVTFLSAARIPAQLQGKPADRPIGIGYARNITTERAFNFAKSLAARLEVGKQTLDQIPVDELEEMSSKAENPISGVAWYMVTGLIPTFEAVTFRQVVDEADAKRMLDVQVRQGGERTSLTGADGKYKVVRSWSWKNELPEGQDPPEMNFGGDRRGFVRTSEVIEEDGKRYHQQTQTWTRMYRYEDGFLFEADFEELHTMPLPTAETIVGGVSTANDLGGEAFSDRIPLGIKQLAWNMLNATLSTQLQQRDDEGPETFDLRRSAGEVGLEAARALIFDLERAEGWLRFANQDSDVIRGELVIEARRNSSLGKTLDDLASVQSRFAPILHDKAAATVHLGVRLPESTRPVFDATAAWLALTVKEDISGDSAMTDAAQQLGTTLRAIGTHGNVEAFVKLGWTEPSGGVIYGGLQVDDNPQLLKSLHHMLTHVPGTPPGIGEQIQLVSIDGRQFVRFQFPPEVQKSFERDGIPLKLTHAYLVHENSCLWIAVGGESAFEIIQQSVKRTAQAGIAAKASMLTFEVDADQWLSYPQDDETGIPALLLWLDANSSMFPPGPAAGAFGGDDKPTPLLQKVFDLGGSRVFQFVVDADHSGLVARLDVGEAVGNYYVARMIDIQDRMMQRNRRQAEESMRRQRELQERLKKEGQQQQTQATSPDAGS
ncbi:MAG: hypothetical protein R3C19_09105 [Planctomycetaceae bacterium]